MAEEIQKSEVQKHEITEEQTERTRDSRLYVPHVDIYEDDYAIHLIADIPGASEESIDITLEKNILTIDAHVQAERPEGYSLTYAEYGIGDFRRRFSLSNEVDRNKISAEVKDGILKLELVKSGPSKPQKISVKGEK